MTTKCLVALAVALVSLTRPALARDLVDADMVVYHAKGAALAAPSTVLPIHGLRSATLDTRASILRSFPGVQLEIETLSLISLPVGTLARYRFAGFGELDLLFEQGSLPRLSVMAKFAGIEYPPTTVQLTPGGGSVVLLLGGAGGSTYFLCLDVGQAYSDP